MLNLGILVRFTTKEREISFPSKYMQLNSSELINFEIRVWNPIWGFMKLVCNMFN